MEILGKVLSEKTEAIYKDITGGLIYPIKIVKLDPRMRKTAAVRCNGYRKERIYCKSR